jgi:predicted RNase H-like HicB family nuclease
MRKRFYPAVLERDASGVFGVWFPDFPGAVAAGQSQEEAVAKAQEALELAMQRWAERDHPLPEPTAFDAIQLPAEADVVTFVALAGAPPDPSERVNIYLPRSVLAQADELAGAWGVSRSSLFGFALTRLTASRMFAAPEAIRGTKKGRRR